MTLSVKHSFQSAKSDGLDTTKVQPSNWNSEHALTAAIDKVLGTNSSDTDVIELACTAAGRAVLAAVDAAAQKAAMNVADIPVGGGFHWFDDALPAANGAVVWAWGNGQAVSRTTYSELFALIGTTYGAGDSSTTFNLPNTCEVALVGRVGMGGAAARTLISSHLAGSASLGTVVGEGLHTLTTAELATHSHANFLTDPTHVHSNFLTDPGHAHSAPALSGNNAPLGGSVQGASNAATGSATTDITLTNVAASTGISIGNANAGSGAAHNTVQPSLMTNFIIRIK